MNLINQIILRQIYFQYFLNSSFFIYYLLYIYITRIDFKKQKNYNYNIFINITISLESHKYYKSDLSEIIIKTLKKYLIKYKFIF